jgi:tRNA threonylcarbamoyladenosine biosynthesis protein TsaE
MTVLELGECAVVWNSASPEETVLMGQTLGDLLAPGDVVALSGDLGSGKTVLARGIAEGLGCRGTDVHSPSFTLVNEYRGRPRGEGAGGRAPLVVAHIDLYRIQSEAEIPGLGWDEYLGSRYVTLVEWAERAGGSLPDDLLRISITAPDADRRRLTVRCTGPRSERLLREWVARAGGTAELA